MTAGRVCRAARLKGDTHTPGWNGDCPAAAEFDAATRGVSTAADAAAATDFDSAAAAVAAADAFGAHFEHATTPLTAAEPQQWGHAVASAEAASAATCCRLPSATAHDDGDKCMSPAKPAVIGDATGQAHQQQALSCYQSAPPPPLAALAQPEGHNWSDSAVNTLQSLRCPLIGAHYSCRISSYRPCYGCLTTCLPQVSYTVLQESSPAALCTIRVHGH